MLYYICKVEKLYDDNKQKENIVSVEKIQRKKHLCITLLGDDETWTEDGMVVLIDTEEAKEWYNEEYEENILEFGWEELQECDIATLIHKDYRAPEKMNAEYLLDFYMTAKCLGFDEVIRDTMEGLKK